MMGKKRDENIARKCKYRLSVYSMNTGRLKYFEMHISNVKNLPANKHTNESN